MMNPIFVNGSKHALKCLNFGINHISLVRSIPCLEKEYSTSLLKFMLTAFARKNVPNFEKWKHLDLLRITVRHYTTDERKKLTDVTVGHCLKTWTKKLKKDGVTEASMSVECIVANALGCKMIHELGRLGKARKLSLEQVSRIEEMCLKRMERVPLQYIIGEWDFRDLTLKMRPPVFIARPESEMLVNLVLENYPPSVSHKFLEICCGSGCVAVSLLKHLPKIDMVAVDCLKEATELTLENARRYNVEGRLQIYQELISAELPACLDNHVHTFDAIVSNPPYVFTDELKEMAPEILNHENIEAFDGGPDGTKVITDIIKLAPKLLKPGGYLWLVGDYRHPDIIYLWMRGQKDLRMEYVKTIDDFSHGPRYMLLQFT